MLARDAVLLHRPHRPRGEDGRAVSLVSAEERPLLAEVEKLLKRRIEQVVVPGFEPGAAPERELVMAGNRGGGGRNRAPSPRPVRGGGGARRRRR